MLPYNFSFNNTPIHFSTMIPYNFSFYNASIHFLLCFQTIFYNASIQSFYNVSIHFLLQCFHTIFLFIVLPYTFSFYNASIQFFTMLPGIFTMLPYNFLQCFQAFLQCFHTIFFTMLSYNLSFYNASIHFFTMLPYTFSFYNYFISSFCGVMVSRLANLHEWVRVLLGAPLIRPCAICKHIVNYYFYRFFMTPIVSVYFNILSYSFIL